MVEPTNKCSLGRCRSKKLKKIKSTMLITPNLANLQICFFAVKIRLVEKCNFCKLGKIQVLKAVSESF